MLSRLAETGFTTISSDDIVRELYQSEEIRAEVFRIVGSPAELSNAELRTLIADDDQVRRKLNRFLHPLVVSRHLVSNATFHEVPLLYETALQKSFDFVWLVTCGAAIQKDRILARYGNIVDSDRLLSTQLDSKIKKAHADCEIRTEFALESVYHQLEIALDQFGLE